jgi:hypothetical protein
VDYAKEPEKSNAARFAEYCYKKYHGAEEGYERVVAAAQANLNPPASFVIESAPAAELWGGPIATIPDIAALSLSDKAFVLQNGQPGDVAKVWESMKGKSVQIPDALVIDVSTRFIKVALSDEAVRSKTADFLVYLKSIKTPPLVGSKVTLAGTYDSLTQNPMLIIMREGVILSPPATRPRSSSSGK